MGERLAEDALQVWREMAKTSSATRVLKESKLSSTQTQTNQLYI